MKAESCCVNFRSFSLLRRQISKHCTCTMVTFAEEKDDAGEEEEEDGDEEEEEEDEDDDCPPTLCFVCEVLRSGFAF